MLDLPFTTEAFLEVFRNYNGAIWPVHLVAYALGLGAIGLVLWKRPYSDKTIVIILAVFWLWMGGVYHLLFFSEINKAAYLFGGLFLVQGFLFLIAGVVNNKVQFQFRGNVFGVVGGVLILYALLIYPLLGILFGHAYPAAPVFGVAPCPTTIFTFGMLLWIVKKVPGWLLLIPGLWAVMGFIAAIRLGIYEDTGLLIAGVVGVSMLLFRNVQRKRELVMG